MDPFIGQIIMFGGNFAPRGWAFCQGQLLAISSNTALFSILGTTYGGDGRTTFGLPDLRGRVPIQQGRGPGLSDHRLGSRGGAEMVTLNQTQIPAHTHAVAATTKVSAGKVTVDSSIQASSKPATVATPTKGSALAAVSAERGKSSNALIYNSEKPDITLAGSTSSTATVEAKAETQVQLGDTGGGLSHTNMQPYLAVNYIIALVGIFPSRS